MKRDRSPGPRRAARSSAVRPTQGRVRDALFNSLGARIEGMWVLDLFAGSGALGLTALSRGAAGVVFVERDRRLTEGIRKALAKEGLTARAEVRRGDALAAVRDLGARGRTFDLILMDPPYGEDWIPRVLRAVQKAGLQAPGGLTVAEGHWRDRPADAPGIRVRREARYGETALWVLDVAPGGPDDAGTGGDE